MTWVIVGAVVWAVAGAFAQSLTGWLIGEARVFRQWWEWPVRAGAFVGGPVSMALTVWAIRRCALDFAGAAQPEETQHDGK